MAFDAWLTLAILVATFATLVASKLPPVTIFLGALTLCITFGLAPIERCLAGFANPGVITIGALFMVAAGMYSTGSITLLSDKVIGRPKKMLAAQLKILPPIAVGSAFLNNTPLVAMMIPVIRDLCRSTGLDKAKLYIPLSFASILGGCSTLIGTATNLIIAGMVVDAMATNAGGGSAHIPDISGIKPNGPSRPDSQYDLVAVPCQPGFKQFISLIDRNGIDSGHPRSTVCTQTGLLHQSPLGRHDDGIL